jgi:dihydroneopterin aldolase
MDIVFLRGLEVETVIGVFDWEREITQKLVIDLEMAADVAAAAATDRLEDALDYKAVSKRVRSWVENHHPLLVETVAEGIARIVRTEFSVPWVRVTVNKQGAITGARDVGIVVERGVRP